MSAQPPSFFARLGLALRVLTDGQFAALVVQAAEQGALPAPAPQPALPAAAAPAPAPEPKAKPKSEPKPPAAPPAPAAPAFSVADVSREGSLHVLAILQREARLLDFCEEELTGYTDAVIGAAARTVHTGVRKVLKSYFDLQPVRTEKEGEQVTVPEGFDARAVRLTGNVVGKPPFKGALRHHGWRAADVKLPEPVRGDASRLLAPAEVELQ
jgi:hypothetical protein